MIEDKKNTLTIKQKIVVTTLLVMLLGGIIAYLLYFKPPSTPVSVSTSSLDDNKTQSESFDIVGTVSITLDQDITHFSKNNITLVAIPDVEIYESHGTTNIPEIPFNITWISDNSFTAQPNFYLQMSTDFTVSLRYKGIEFYTTTLSVVDPSNLTFDEQARLAGIIETEYQEGLKTFYETYPFMTKLPLITDDYSARWNGGENEIYVMIKNTSPDYDRNQIISDLQAIGVDTDTIPVIFE